MDSGKLSDTEKAIVKQALRAATNGPFFPDWEFHTLFGLERSKFRAIAEAWPELAAPANEVAEAVNDPLNNLLGYPHDKEALWSRWISVNRPQLENLFLRFRD